MVNKRTASKIDRLTDSIETLYSEENLVVLGNPESKVILVELDGRVLSSKNKKILRNIVAKLHISRYTIRETVSFNANFKVTNHTSELEIHV